MPTPQQTLSIINVEEFVDHVLLPPEEGYLLLVMSAAICIILSADKLTHIPKEVVALRAYPPYRIVMDDQKEEVL